MKVKRAKIPSVCMTISYNCVKVTLGCKGLGVWGGGGVQCLSLKEYLHQVYSILSSLPLDLCYSAVL